MAKRTADGLICRLLVLGLSLAVVAAGTWVVYRGARIPAPLADWVWAGLLLWCCFGGAQWLAERRVDESNALSRLALVTSLRTLLPLVVVVAVDWWIKPGVVPDLIGFLIVAYVTGLLVSTWLTLHVVEPPPLPNSSNKN